MTWDEIFTTMRDTIEPQVQDAMKILREYYIKNIQGLSKNAFLWMIRRYNKDLQDKITKTILEINKVNKTEQHA